MLTVVAAVAAATLLGGCATSQKIQVVQPGDPDLPCGAIKNEIAKLDAAQADIDSKKGLTGTNVASALFWLPGLLISHRIFLMHQQNSPREKQFPHPIRPQLFPQILVFLQHQAH